MARISKREQAAFGAADRQPEKIYSVGIYARLSVDSGKACGEIQKNESIETQVEIAKEFIGRQKDMAVYDSYIDVGRTGSSFEREGFERMMRDVRLHRIDCIVVKDLSRFGRNHIETGNYIEKIFPFLGVRFIAVTDNFDSNVRFGQNEALDVSLKNLVNEMYAKDIAVKVKSSRKAKWEQGSFTGGVPPYGYRAEWVGDRKCLFIEEKTSDIVKKIFELFLSGRNRKEIVLWLYENRVVRPAEYHRTGQVCCQEEEKLEQWPRGTVQMILTNPVYMGCLVQGRTRGRNDRICHEQDIGSGDRPERKHTHEAIISEELFLEAAGKLKKTSVYGDRKGGSRTAPLEEDIFADVLCCGDCGSKMKRISAVRKCSAKDRAYSYHCPRSGRIDRFRCTGKRISLCSLTDIVREAIRQEFSLSVIRPESFAERSEQEAEALREEWNRRLAELERRTKGLIKRGSEQYLKYRMGEIDEECFRRRKEENDKKVAALKRESAAAAENLRAAERRTSREDCFLGTLVKGGGMGRLTAEAVRTLIDRIEIYPDHRVKVIFAFQRIRSAAI